MFAIGKYHFSEKHFNEVIEAGTPMCLAYPQLPSDVLEKLQEIADGKKINRPKKKRTKKK